MGRLLYGLMVVALLGLSGCGDVGEVPLETGEVESVEESKNGFARPGVSQSFNRNLVVTDEFFNDYDSMSVGQVQQFLESSPYGRSWLANESTRSGTVAQTVVALSREYRINPIMLLSRMQVEASLISQSQRPSQHRINYAMGCGCADGTNCAYAPIGLEPQLRCGAEKFRELYDRSANGNGWWLKGTAKATLDGITIYPSSHATASLYAYTPWVLTGTGGTWLAWKIVALFDRHVGFSSAGPSAASAPVEASSPTGGATYRVRSGDSCWSAAQYLGCDYRQMVNCSTNRGCDFLDIDDVLACSNTDCSSASSVDSNGGSTFDDLAEPSCGHYQIESGQSCWNAAQALGCSTASIVNCTEPTAGCAGLLDGDVVACGRGCCP